MTGQGMDMLDRIVATITGLLNKIATIFMTLLAFGSLAALITNGLQIHLVIMASLFGWAAYRMWTRSSKSKPSTASKRQSAVQSSIPDHINKKFEEGQSISTITTESNNDTLSFRDNEWGRLNQEAMDHACQMKWGLYTNTQFEMAKHLKKEGNHNRELEFLLWILYLDINGPQNIGILSPALSKEFPPFDPTDSIVAPAIIERAASIIENLDISTDAVKHLFIKIATERRNKLMPITPEHAWRKIEDELP